MYPVYSTTNPYIQEQYRNEMPHRLAEIQGMSKTRWARSTPNQWAEGLIGYSRYNPGLVYGCGCQWYIDSSGTFFDFLADCSD